MMVQDIETTEAFVNVFTTGKENVYKVLINRYIKTDKGFEVKKAGFSRHFTSNKYGEALARDLGTFFGLTNAYTLNDFRKVV